MLSKKKNVRSRGEVRDNKESVLAECEKDKKANEVAKIASEAIPFKNQVEDFLLSEYFKNDEFLGMSCWDICSIYNTQRNSSNNESDGSEENRPITAIALMFLNQYSSLPRSIKRW